MGYAGDQRHAFSDALSQVGPDAPTLCQGWTAYDLAAHCWAREHNARALVGIGVKRFEGLADQAMADVRERYGYAELASNLRQTPPTPVTLLPGGDDLVNAAEYFIHTEDVRRANGLPLRTLPRDFSDLLWKRLGLIGRMFFGGSPVGVILERSDVPGESQRVKAGAKTVTIVGRPGELVLFAFGREEAADVQIIGLPEAVRGLLAAKRGA